MLRGRGLIPGGTADPSLLRSVAGGMRVVLAAMRAGALERPANGCVSTKRAAAFSHGPRQPDALSKIDCQPAGLFSLRPTTSGTATRATRATESATSTHHCPHVNFKGRAFEFLELYLLGVGEDGHRCFRCLLTGRFHLFSHGFETRRRTTSSRCSRSTTTLEG